MFFVASEACRQGRLESVAGSSGGARLLRVYSRAPPAAAAANCMQHFRAIWEEHATWAALQTQSPPAARPPPRRPCRMPPPPGGLAQTAAVADSFMGGSTAGSWGAACMAIQSASSVEGELGAACRSVARSASHGGRPCNGTACRLPCCASGSCLGEAVQLPCMFSKQTGSESQFEAVRPGVCKARQRGGSGAQRACDQSPPAPRSMPHSPTWPALLIAVSLTAGQNAGQGRRHVHQGSSSAGWRSGGAAHRPRFGSPQGELRQPTAAPAACGSLLGQMQMRWCMVWGCGECRKPTESPDQPPPAPMLAGTAADAPETLPGPAPSPLSLHPRGSSSVPDRAVPQRSRRGTAGQARLGPQGELRRQGVCKGRATAAVEAVTATPD